MAVKHIKTATGFELTIDDQCLDDMELFDAIADVQAGNNMAASIVVGKICGNQKKALYDHLRQNGRVPIQSVTDTIVEIFEALGAKKS